MTKRTKKPKKELTMMEKLDIESRRRDCITGIWIAIILIGLGVLTIVTDSRF